MLPWISEGRVLDASAAQCAPRSRNRVPGPNWTENMVPRIGSHILPPSLPPPSFLSLAWLRGSAWSLGGSPLETGHAESMVRSRRVHGQVTPRPWSGHAAPPPSQQRVRQGQEMDIGGGGGRLEVAEERREIAREVEGLARKESRRRERGW